METITPERRKLTITTFDLLFLYGTFCLTIIVPYSTVTMTMKRSSLIPKNTKLD